MLLLFVLSGVGQSPVSAQHVSVERCGHDHLSTADHAAPPTVRGQSGARDVGEACSGGKEGGRLYGSYKRPHESRNPINSIGDVRHSLLNGSCAMWGVLFYTPSKRKGGNITNECR